MNGMKNKLILEALDEVKAPVQLKQDTKEAVFNAMQQKHHHRLPLALAGAAALVIVLFSGGYFWFTPVVAISVEADAEIALRLNCFDRVVDVEGLNEMGAQVIAEQNLEGKTYDEVADILSEYCDDYALTIVGNEERCQKMEKEIIENTNVDASDIHCSQNQEEMEEAHAHGMSVGRYRAWMALQDEVSEEEFQEMTMQEIHEKMGQRHHRHGRN